MREAFLARQFMARAPSHKDTDGNGTDVRQGFDEKAKAVLKNVTCDGHLAGKLSGRDRHVSLGR